MDSLSALVRDQLGMSLPADDDALAAAGTVLPTDPPADAPADVPASGSITVDTPIDTSSPTDADAVSFVIDREGEGGVPDGVRSDGAVPPSPSEPAAFRPADTVSIDEMARAAYGSDLTPAQAATMFDLYDRINAMPPHMQTATAALLQGDVQTAANYLGIAQPQQQAPATAPVTASPWDDDEPSTADPQLLARLAEIEQRQQAIYVDQQRQQEAQVVAQANLGLNDFGQRYQGTLSPSEIAGLQHAVNQNGALVYQRAQANGGDFRTAYHDGLEAQLYANPELRKRIIEAEAQQTRETMVADEERKRKAASVAGGGMAPSAAQANPAMPMVPASPFPPGYIPSDQELAAQAAAMIRQSMGAMDPPR